MHACGHHGFLIHYHVVDLVYVFDCGLRERLVYMRVFTISSHGKDKCAFVLTPRLPYLGRGAPWRPPLSLVGHTHTTCSLSAQRFSIVRRT